LKSVSSTSLYELIVDSTELIEQLPGFGYPGIVRILIFIAAVGGLFLASVIVVGDERVERKSGSRCP